MNNSPNRAKRLVFMISGGIDALIGAIFLLLGFGFLPVDVTQYGFETWHVDLLGAVMFLLGAGTFVYNLARLDE